MPFDKRLLIIQIGVSFVRKLKPRPKIVHKLGTRTFNLLYVYLKCYVLYK